MISAIQPVSMKWKSVSESLQTTKNIISQVSKDDSQGESFWRLCAHPGRDLTDPSWPADMSGYIPSTHSIGATPQGPRNFILRLCHGTGVILEKCGCSQVSLPGFTLRLFMAATSFLETHSLVHREGKGSAWRGPNGVVLLYPRRICSKTPQCIPEAAET